MSRMLLLFALAACSRHKAATIDAPGDVSPSGCIGIDASLADYDIVASAIYSCGCCSEGERQCVTPTLDRDGRIVSIAADPTAPPRDLACITSKLIGRCLPALTGSVCTLGV